MDFFHTHISPQAIKYAIDALESTFISEGKLVKAFENQLSDRLGIRNPVAVNSGTTALHLSLVLAGVGFGDEVIIPAQTFVATGLAVLMQQAIPVFADIDPMTGNIDPASIEKKITHRTKAVIPVHWGGYPCEMDEILAIASKYGLAVIEDAAHALGATYRGKPIGTLSRFTAFSFQAIKHVTTGDGGLIACLSEDDAKRALTLRWFGIDRANSKPSILGERQYDIKELGYKYHLNDLAAAVGLGNLEDFPVRLARQQSIANCYRSQLSGVPGLNLLRQADDRTSAYWLFTVLVEHREEFIAKLREYGIPASVVHLRIDHNSVFGGKRNDLPGQEYFNERQVAIPVHAGLSNDDVNRIVEAIKSGW